MLVKSGNSRVADIHTVTVSYYRVFGKMCDVDYALYYEIVQRKGLTSGEGSHRRVSYTEVCETVGSVDLPAAALYIREDCAPPL